jgi:linoleoyl-CoA desaturase
MFYVSMLTFSSGVPAYSRHSVAIQYAPRTRFRDDLEIEVAAFFERRGISRQGSYALWAKTAVLGIWLAGSYWFLVFVVHRPWLAALCAASLACAMAGIGFNVMHDGGHRSYAKSSAVSRGMAFSLDLLGGSSYFWHYKHGIAHHSYPNVTGSDDDIYIGALGRLTPHDRRFWFHRFQHFYIWLLYGLLAIKWQLLDDFRSIIRPGIADTRVPRPPRTEQILFWSGKVLFFGLALGLPMLLHPWPSVVALFLLTGTILGVLLSVVFQLAHCLEEAAFAKRPLPGHAMDRDWATHQVESTVDFARNNRVLTWFIGGLNFQIEHHLFPRVCHTHYPALSEIVERVCRTHGVHYAAHLSASAALGSHYRWLRQLGRA